MHGQLYRRAEAQALYALDLDAAVLGLDYRTVRPLCSGCG
jgi:hypothetical protein